MSGSAMVSGAVVVMTAMPSTMDDEEQGHHLPAFAQSLANEFGEW